MSGVRINNGNNKYLGVPKYQSAKVTNFGAFHVLRLLRNFPEWLTLVSVCGHCGGAMRGAKWQARHKIATKSQVRISPGRGRNSPGAACGPRRADTPPSPVCPAGVLCMEGDHATTRQDNAALELRYRVEGRARPLLHY